MEAFEIIINEEMDIINARIRIRQLLDDCEQLCKLSIRIDVLTIVSELSRNIYKYAGKGKIIVEMIKDDIKTGIKLFFIDNGPGIPDINSAMKPKIFEKHKDGLGLGLIGSKRLSDEFSIFSVPGQGTTITVVKWFEK